MRRLTAILAVVFVSGFLPLTASLGFCATRPCCREHRSAATAMKNLPPCCNESNCATAAPDAQAIAATHLVQAQLHCIATLSIALEHRQTVVLRQACIFESPPPLSRRLATLSILLI